MMPLSATTAQRHLDAKGGARKSGHRLKLALGNPRRSFQVRATKPTPLGHQPLQRLTPTRVFQRSDLDKSQPLPGKRQGIEG